MRRWVWLAVWAAMFYGLISGELLRIMSAFTSDGRPPVIGAAKRTPECSPQRP